MNELVVIDLDNTLINGYSQQLFLKYLLQKKFITLGFYLKLSLWFVLYKLNLAKNPEAMMEFAYGFLKGRGSEEVQKLAADFFETVLKKIIFSDLVALINEHRAKGRKLLIVSSVPDVLVKEIARFLEITEYKTPHLEVANGKFTGKISKIVYGKNKTSSLHEFANEKGFSLKSAWAYADHFSDLDMLQSVAHPFVVNPGKKLLREAQKRSWPVLHFKDLL